MSMSQLTVRAVGLLLLAVASPMSAQDDGPPVELVSRAESFVAHLRSGQFEEATASFDSTMKSQFSATRLADTWAAVQAQMGDYLTQESVRHDSVQGYRRIFLTSTFESAKLDIMVVFNDRDEISGLFFRPAAAPVAPSGAPSYAVPESYREVAVTVGQEGWELPGTLTLPMSGGPFPAVVLVHGSGPNDRDETVGANKPFRDLALGLASLGVAVLRYDKRTMVHASRLGDVADFTVREETIDDALAAVAFLQSHSQVDGERVFVLGHSLGGTVAPRIGSAAPGIAGLIIMAGAVRPLEDLILEQTTYLIELDGEISEAERVRHEQIAQEVALVRALSDNQDDSVQRVLGAPAAYWLDLRSHPPAATAAELDIPMLILQGERDYQVTMADYAGWRQALAGRPNVVFVSYPELNHLFIAGEGASGPEEYQRPGNVSQQVVRDIASWITGAGAVE